MTHISGTQDQMKAFLSAPIEGPIHMLNLLRFKEDGGSAKYSEYGKAVTPMLEQRGGKSVYRGKGRMAVIGDEEWDLILIIEYPTRDAFQDMVTSDEYQAIVHLRHDALEDSRLVCMQTK